MRIFTVKLSDESFDKVDKLIEMLRKSGRMYTDTKKELIDGYLLNHIYNKALADHQNNVK